MITMGSSAGGPQLIRVPYQSTATGQTRQFLVHLPAGYDTASARTLAARQLPIWMFHGGRDTLNKPQWAYDMANALEQAGHRSVRLTVHEDCGHDCWTRVYGGQDLYDWFLQHTRV